MGREVEQVRTFERNPKFGLRKQKLILRCNDGAVYEFEKAAGHPSDEPPRFVRSFDGSGTKMRNTGARKRLPDAVEETVETLVGGWTK